MYIVVLDSPPSPLLASLVKLELSILSEDHRRLQSCVGTWVRLGYAAFDAQLYFCHYTIVYVRLCVCKLIYIGGLCVCFS